MPDGTIRHAEMIDKIAVLGLMRDFYYAKGLDREDGPTGIVIAADIAYAEAFFLRHLHDPMSCCIVLDVDGRARGALLATAIDQEFGEAGTVRIATENMWWVDQRHRGSASLRMVDAFEQWGRSIGCVGAAMREFCDQPVGVIYRRKGYRPLETMHFKRL